MDSQMIVRDSVLLRQENGREGNSRYYQLRPAHPADRETIIANINAIGAEDIYFPSNRYVPTPDWETALQGSSANGSNYLLAVVEVNGDIVGHGRLFPTGFGHKDSHVIDVGMGLLKSYRGLGVGTALLAYLINWAEKTGYEKMTATMLYSNVRARHLFARHHFKPEGMRIQQFKIGDEYVDELLVAKFL